MTSSKKVIVSFIGATSMLLSACTKNEPVITATQKKDFFEKKLTCSTFLEKVKNRIEKENREEIALAEYDKTRNYGHRSVFEICYSKALNTCVGFISETTYNGGIKGRKTIMQTYSAVDILTDAEIDSTFQNFDKNGERVPAGEGQPNYWKEHNEIKKKIDCAE